MKIEQRKTSNKSTRGIYQPELIVVHTSEGTYEGGISWLCNPASQASTHFFVGRKGQVAQLVDIENAAWGNATIVKDKNDKRFYKKSTNSIVASRPANANRYTISIECESIREKDGGELTDIQQDVLINLICKIIVDVKEAYGVNIKPDTEHIARHCELTPEWKPFCAKNIDTEKIAKEVKARLNKFV